MSANDLLFTHDSADHGSCAAAVCSPVADWIAGRRAELSDVRIVASYWNPDNLPWHKGIIVTYASSGRSEVLLAKTVESARACIDDRRKTFGLQPIWNAKIAD